MSNAFKDWTADQVRQHNERVAKGKAKANSGNRDTREAPKLEPDPSHAALAAVQVQSRTGQKFLVSVTAVRTRLIDIDNLCEKYHVDLCRYASIIPNDDPATTLIEVRQQKAGKGQEEFTRIEIYEIEEDLTQPTLL